MQRTSYIVILAIGLIAAACGGGNEAPKTLEGKKALLAAKKQTLLTLNKEISALETEINAEDPNAGKAKRVTSVAAEALTPVTFQHFVKVQGQIEANKNVMVSPQTAGVITKINVREGQSVRRGQVLAQIDDAVMRSSIEELKTSLELATIMLDKQQKLWDQEIGTEVQLLTAKNQKEGLERRLATLEEQLEMSKIKAPISGIVDEINPKMGEAVSPGFPAFRIFNPTDLSLKADLSETYIPYVDRGDKVMVTFPALDKSIDAKVTVVGNSIHPNDRTFPVEVKLPNNKMFKPNMFGEIEINDRSVTEAITIPASLIQQSNEGAFVYVAESAGEEWKAKRRMIQTDLSYKGQVQVTEGLASGDRLITVGFKDLSDGQAISLRSDIAADN
ncbi:MAG: efflux RND transporter periplasmic adaptor subunit [Bacteroidota bacterium]